MKIVVWQKKIFRFAPLKVFLLVFLFLFALQIDFYLPLEFFQGFCGTFFKRFSPCKQTSRSQSGWKRSEEADDGG
jgi:hypothetical protein